MARLSLTLSMLLAIANGLTVHEQIASVPNGWTHASTPSPDQSMTLQIALVKQNLDQLESHLSSVSTPHGANYGKYLDVDAVNSLFPVSDASKTAVTNWLTQAGIKSFKVQGDSVFLTTTVSKANSLLNTTFGTYNHQSSSATKLRTTQYSLPDNLTQHIDLIAPTTYFGSPAVKPKVKVQENSQASSKASAVPASCKQTLQFEGETFRSFGPDCLKEIYSVGSYTPKANGGSRIGFGSFLNQSADFADLFQFQKMYNIPQQNFSVTLVNPQNGATDQPQPVPVADDGEANLDVQYISGISHPLPITSFITAGGAPYYPDPVEPAGTPDENEPYLEYYEYLMTQSNSKLPQVITNSYGDEEQTVPENYARRVCNLIGIMGLRGISILESSGDEGVGASCLSTDGKTPQFNPIFPATCPYVTSVGGLVSFGPEVAWQGSSGGFSYYFQRPWYQQQAVSQYLTHVSPQTKQYYSKYTNFNGRGFPDVSAHSVSPDYTVIQGGQVTPSGGTSAAAPVTAAIVALLNDARLRQGKSALGFLNPLIYLIGNNGFTDITGGSSVGCNGNNTQTGQVLPGAGIIPGAEWNATTGWDPVTGYGSPNFQKLLALATAF